MATDITITQEITIELDGKSPFEYVVMKQGDKGSRILAVSLLQNKQPYEIPTGCTARIKYYKPDGNPVLNDCTLSGSKILVTYTEQMLAAKGVGKGEIVLLKDGKELKSATYYTKIVETVYKTEWLTSDKEFMSMTTIFNDMDQAAQKAMENAKIAEKAAEQANEKTGKMQGYIDKYLKEHTVEIDETLSEQKKAAPANVVGEIKEEIDSIKEDLKNIQTLTDGSVSYKKISNIEYELAENSTGDEGESETKYYNLFDKDTMVTANQGISSGGKIISNSWGLARVSVNGNAQYSLKLIESDISYEAIYYGAQTAGCIGFADNSGNITSFLSLGYTQDQVDSNTLGINCLIKDYAHGTFTGTSSASNGIEWVTFTTPSDCKYVLFNTTLKNNQDKIQLEEGDTIHAYYLPYEEKPIIDVTGNELSGYEIKSLFNAKLKDEYAREQLKEISANKITKFKGKTWAVFGDSLSQPNSDGVDKYYNYIAADLNMSVNSYAVGGSGYFKGSGTAGWGDNNIPYQIENALTGYNVVSIMAGVNESLLTMGDITDEIIETPTTLCGAVKKSIEMAIEKYPLATIFVMTSIPGTGNNSTPAQGKLHNYSEKIIEICKMYNIPCLDLFHCSGLRPWNTEFATKYYRDYIHLLTNGHKLIADPIKEFMKTLFVN